MSRLKVHLFSYPYLTVDDKRIDFQRRKTLALAAYFFLESGTSQQEIVGKRIFPASCSMDFLANLFWPEASRQLGGVYLRQALGEFSRAAGEGWLIKEGQSILMNPQAETWVDVHEFELILEAWKAGRFQPEKVIPSLMEAAMLYQGDFLAGFSVRDSPGFSNWQTLQAEQLRLHMIQILGVLVKLNMRQQDMDAALVYAKRWLDLDRLDESAHQAVMYSYLKTGQLGAAQRQYESCRNILETELGVEPAAQTTALLEERREPAQTTVYPVYSRMNSVPTGTVTFLFTDIEGSTHLWETYPHGMQQAFKRHEEIICQAMRENGGYVYKMIGDAFQVAFSTAHTAMNAAIEAQRNLHAEPWGEVGQIKVRMALHSGVTEERGNDYLGPELNRAARILNSGYGGQVLLSQPVYELVYGHLPTGVSILDLGENRLKDLFHPEHIYQLLASDLPNDFPPLKTLNSLNLNLPVMTTEFVGRERELMQIESLLSNPDCRLITLLGMGGSGKTRLAIQAASLSQSFQHNACFVHLAAASSKEEMIYAVAQSLKFKFQRMPGSSLSHDAIHAQLCQYLAQKRLLLILDNFEQLIEHADFISDLLKAAPQMKVIVTSRVRLNLAEEWVLDVNGLSFPVKLRNEHALDYAAVQLFITRAQHTCGAKVIPEDYPAIIRISQLLEGVPLGIEMAAAWVKMLSCIEIASEIERDLDFLSASWRGIPERQQTLRAVFDHSWRLLTDKEREGFINLAVFSGGFNRQAAWETAGVNILMLASLTDKSFLRRLPNGRYEIHPVLIGYVHEKLVERATQYEEVRAQHAFYFAEWLYHMADKLKGPGQLQALTFLRAEMGNLRAALQRMVAQHDFTRLEKMLPSLVLFLTINDQRVTTQELNMILTQLKDDLSERQTNTTLLALVLAILNFFTVYSSDYESHLLYQKESLRLIPDLEDNLTKAYALLLNCVGSTDLGGGLDVKFGQESLRLFSIFGDIWSIAMAQLVLGDICVFGHHMPEEARAYYQCCIQTFSKLEDDWGVSLGCVGLVEVNLIEERWEEAYRLGLKAVDLLERLGNVERISGVRDKLGELALKLSRIEDARQHFTENMMFFAQIGDEKNKQYYYERMIRADIKNAMIQ